VAVGAIQAIALVVLLALVRFIRLVARPKVEILGAVEGYPGLHSIERHPEARTIPGLLLFRFNAPVVFFNAPYFKRQVLDAVAAAGPDLKWFVVDLIPVTMMDATGLQVAREVLSALQERGILFVGAGRQAEWQQWAETRKLQVDRTGTRTFPTLRAAVKAFQRETAAATDGPATKAGD
jgi:MFS superfamily sulfate permease-like transporter